MPKLQQTAKQEVVPYGVAANTNQMPFQERLMEKFGPTEYVKVINVDDEPYMWQYLPGTADDYEYTPDGMHRHARWAEPEVWMLDPGESETIVGANAYLMIEGLYKKLVAKKVEATVEVKPGMARAFNFADGGLQETWINKILIGKEIPSFTSLNDSKELDEPLKRGPGRPAHQTV